MDLFNPDYYDWGHPGSIAGVGAFALAVLLALIALVRWVLARSRRPVDAPAPTTAAPTDYSALRDRLMVAVRDWEDWQRSLDVLKTMTPRKRRAGVLPVVALLDDVSKALLADPALLAREALKIRNCAKEPLELFVNLSPATPEGQPFRHAAELAAVWDNPQRPSEEELDRRAIDLALQVPYGKLARPASGITSEDHVRYTRLAQAGLIHYDREFGGIGPPRTPRSGGGGGIVF